MIYFLLLAVGNWGVVGGSAVGGRVDATFPNLAKFPGSFHFSQRREERVLVRGPTIIIRVV